MIRLEVDRLRFQKLAKIESGGKRELVFPSRVDGGKPLCVRY